MNGYEDCYGIACEMDSMINLCVSLTSVSGALFNHPKFRN